MTMALPLHWHDKLRIERTVWTLDTLLADMPGRARRSARRDLRVNLRAAASEVGTAQALRDLGSVRRIALDYLDAEYGEHRPRPRVLKGIFWALLVEMVILSWFFVGQEGFVSGLQAAGQPAGTFSWTMLQALGIESEVTFDDTGIRGASMFFHPWFLAYIFAAFFVGGRLWRFIPAWWRARRRHTTAPPVTN
jgi:hypothetical protein